MLTDVDRLAVEMVNPLQLGSSPFIHPIVTTSIFTELPRRLGFPHTAFSDPYLQQARLESHALNPLRSPLWCLKRLGVVARIPEHLPFA